MRLLHGGHPFRCGVPKIIEELRNLRRSERENRIIDHDQEASMELEKRERIFLSSPAETKGLLRFLTAGSVDDGKSTLIGRLLDESDGVYATNWIPFVNTPLGRTSSLTSRC
jgi:hypothetical protein